MRKAEREAIEARIQARPEFAYASKASAGEPTKYVFQDKVCLGLSEAMLYVSELEGKDREDNH